MELTYSVIMPVYKNWNNQGQKRIVELIACIHNPIQIVVVNDNPELDIDQSVAFWQKQVNYNPHTITYLKNSQNYGFGGSMNRGARAATGTVFAFLSDDVEVSGDFTEEITPLLTSASGYLIGRYLNSGNTGWNKFGNFIVPYLNGDFLACHRDVWGIIGGFDPRYAPYDFEDVDLSYKATLYSIQLYELKKKCLRHIGGQSIGYSKEREEITVANRKKFAEKWGFSDAP